MTKGEFELSSGPVPATVLTILNVGDCINLGGPLSQSTHLDRQRFKAKSRILVIEETHVGMRRKMRSTGLNLQAIEIESISDCQPARKADHLPASNIDQGSTVISRLARRNDLAQIPLQQVSLRTVVSVN